MSKEELHLEKASSSQDVTSAFQSLPFESIIGDPLRKAIEEQEKLAKESLDFIKEVGFDINPVNKKGGNK